MPHDLLVFVADALNGPLRDAGYARRSTTFRRRSETGFWTVIELAQHRSWAGPDWMLFEVVYTVAPPAVVRWLSRGGRPPALPAVRHGLLCPAVVPPEEFWEGAGSLSTDPIWRIDRAAAAACAQACVDAVAGHVVPLLAGLSQERALLAELARPRRDAAVKGFSYREVSELLTILDTAPEDRVLDLLDRIPHVPGMADFRRTFVAWVHAELAARNAPPSAGDGC